MEPDGFTEQRIHFMWMYRVTGYLTQSTEAVYNKLNRRVLNPEV